MPNFVSVLSKHTHIDLHLFFADPVKWIENSNWNEFTHQMQHQKVVTKTASFFNALWVFMHGFSCPLSWTASHSQLRTGPGFIPAPLPFLLCVVSLVFTTIFFKWKSTIDHGMLIYSRRYSCLRIKELYNVAADSQPRSESCLSDFIRSVH